MNDTKSQSDKDGKQKATRGNVSADGLWRTFPKVPNLRQYVSTGAYYARVKVEGKSIRRSLKATTFEEAKLALHDFLKANSQPQPERGTLGKALKQYLRSINVAHDLSENTKRYRRYCLKAILATWPGFRMVRADKVTLAACQDWASRFTAKYDEQFYNNTLGSLRAILDQAGLTDNPAMKIKRLGVKPKKLQLPEPDQFHQILVKVETAGAPQSQDCADFVRFLAFSGCRLSEARRVTWQDVDFGRMEITVNGSKRQLRSNASSVRTIPIIPPMKALLERLAQEPHKPTDPVCGVGECEKSLTNACEKLGIARITHHDLRHLFATRCIESGVDIQTVSRWLGHVDGGALAMKTYGHLRRQHSAAMALKVTFDSAPADKVIDMATAAA